MDCPWPWTVHGHGLSMAMDSPWLLKKKERNKISPGGAEKKESSSKSLNDIKKSKRKKAKS